MNEKKTFTYDGVNSERFGLWISGALTYGTPERDVEMVSVPGRNGDLEFYNGRYKNVTISYAASGIIKNFKERLADFTAWALSKSGYKRLEDDYHTDYYRLARLISPINMDIVKNLKAGQIDIEFDCKPQKFLKSGEAAVTYTKSGAINNPTHYNAKPLIRVYGAGTVKIGAYEMTLSNNGTYTDIDCDIMNAYNATENLNKFLTVKSELFPELMPGSSAITIGQGITKIEITPRWWTL